MVEVAVAAEVTVVMVGCRAENSSEAVNALSPTNTQPSGEWRPSAQMH